VYFSTRVKLDKNN